MSKHLFMYMCMHMNKNRYGGGRGNAPPTQQIRWAVSPFERAIVWVQDGNGNYSSHL